MLLCGLAVVAILAVVGWAQFTSRHDVYGTPTPLMEAVYSDSPERIEALVRAGGDVDGATSVGYTPLMEAAGPHVEVIDVLLELGADPNARIHHRGWTALTFAVVRGSVPATQALLRAGADLSVVATGGEFDGDTLCDIAERQLAAPSDDMAASPEDRQTVRDLVC